MDYHIYYHDDFDGTLCSALLLDFLRSKGDDVTEFIPMNYNSNLKKEWPEYKFKSPFVIVDFIHHPQADWWFDHHASAFIKPEWQDNFKNNKQHHFDPLYKSCYGMILEFLKKEYQYQPLPIFSELEDGANKVDSASFPSARDALTMDSLAQKLAFLIDSFSSTDPAGHQFQRDVMDALISGEIETFVDKPENVEKVEGIKNKIDGYFDVYSKHAKVIGKVSFLDATELDIGYTPFVGRALFPELEYTVAINGKDNDFHLGVSRNHWLKKESNINIGEMMREFFGGGGHKDVGGAEANNYEDVSKMANKIVEYLNNHE